MKIITLILEIINKMLSLNLKRSKNKKQSYAKTVLSENLLFKNASDVVKRLVDETCIDRCLIVVYHNDGKPIDEAKVKRVSVLFEAHEMSITSVMKQYQQFQVDEDYHQMIVKLRASKQLKFTIDEAPSKIVQYAYKQEGLQKIRLYELAESEVKDVYVFASLSSREKRSLNFREKNHVLLATTQLKPIIQQILKI